MSVIEKEITSWFQKNKRDLPWRNTHPWGVLVSEIMLQQTPVNRVLPIWQQWMDTWPTPKDLASASPAQVITAWGRLGYPRRALRLRECAQVISTEYRNKVPDNEMQLKSLPGIGDYTAAAIMAFAFEERSLVLDINIRRLFSRMYDGVESPTSAPNKNERAIRAEILPSKNAHVWAAATMELGALVCTSQKPKCEVCPVANKCRWRSLNYPKSAAPKKTQSWNGTDRQCRGTIVQALRENASLTENEILKLWALEEQVRKALATLIADGLIAQSGRKRYSLPH
ncbi:unannotated protein [freshwater metagenome]|uniref:Adenine DNA glycosylase n=1 Tax=freshwater metagenome TaxID=449393 RepID=A0A6J7XRM6_9ZZZZ|nr:hypothetical protein [Actinomycetota bacterium]